VTRLNRLYVPETLAAAIVVLGFVGLLGLAAYFLANPLQAWADRLPLLAHKLELRFNAIQQSIAEMRDIAEQIEEVTQSGPDNQSGGGGADSPDIVNVVLDRTRSALVTLLTMLVLLFFLLAQGTHLSRQFLEMTPDSWRRGTGEELLNDLRSQIATYLRTFTLINIGFGAVTYVAMTLLGLPDALLWGLLAGVLNFLPYVGPLIMLAVISTASLLHAFTLSGILLPPLTYAVLNMIEGNIVTPHLLGRRLTLNPVVIFVSVLFWSWAWGPVGAILAVPVLAVVRITADYVAPARKMLPLLE
jgi:predicted PurR-regulated permease PerM